MNFDTFVGVEVQDVEVAKSLIHAMLSENQELLDEVEAMEGVEAAEGLEADATGQLGEGPSQPAQPDGRLTRWGTWLTVFNGSCRLCPEAMHHKTAGILKALRTKVATVAASMDCSCQCRLLHSCQAGCALQTDVRALF